MPVGATDFVGRESVVGVATRYEMDGSFVNVTKIITVCQKMAHLASYFFVREIKSDMKEKVCLQWKSNGEEVKKLNITS
jgi:hypothetical protein